MGTNASTLRCIIANNIRKHRVELGFTYKELADVSTLSVATVRNYECMYREFQPTIAVLECFAKAFNIEVVDLLKKD